MDAKAWVAIGVGVTTVVGCAGYCVYCIGRMSGIRQAEEEVLNEDNNKSDG